jgi:hypothetical protein
MVPAGDLGTRVAIPPEAVGDPAGGDEIGQAVVVDVDDPLAAVVDEFVVDPDGAELMLLPLSTLGAGVLVPVGSAEKIGEAVVVHVEERDAFGVVGAQTMREKGNASGVAGAVAWLRHTVLGGVRRVLGMEGIASERQCEEQS